MKQRIVSTNLFRILVIIALVIPMTFGATFPASASFNSYEVVGWGYNAEGKFTTPSDLTDVIAIAAGGYHNLALRSDGTVVAWGTNYHGQSDVPADLSGVVAIAAGDAHSLALKSDGTVVGWGENAQGQTDIPSDLTDVVAIDAGMFHNLARKSDGTFVGWGNNGYDQITFPAGLADVVAFDVGQNHNLAIKPDDTVVAWGYNWYGQTNVPEGLADVVAVAAGGNHSLALKRDGTVVAWGNNTYGQTDIPSGLTGVVAIAAGGTHSLALKSDGTVVGWGENSYGQSSPPSDLSGAVAIYAGNWHSLALVPQIAPQVVYDNFDDNFTNPSLWSIELKDRGPTASETNQRLELTIPPDSAGNDFAAWYDSACQLHGDYDIQVDYEVLTWPLANGVRIGLADDHANMQRISSGRQPYDYPGGPDLYLTTFDTADHVVGITPTSDLSGKLRLERVGETINSYYFANGGWVTVASYSDPAYTQDTAFYLGAWSADSVFADQEVKVTFDNMIINVGEMVCPTAAAPDLAITQVADQETVSTGDPMGFTITVTNNGDATANIVTLTDTLPVYPDFSWSVSGTDAAACVLTGGALSCNFGDMPPGAVKTIRLTAPEYVYYSKCFSPIITSTATLMAYNQPVNQTATASVAVLCPYMFIDLYSDTIIVQPGDPVSYTVTIGNIGDGNGKDVEAFLDLQTPPGVSWAITEVTPSSAAGNCALELDGTWTELTCLFDQITPQEEVIIEFTSPTTSESCGTFGAAGGVRASNFVGFKTKMYYLTVNCPVVDTTPPVITPTVTGTLGANDWYTGDVSLTWSVSDPESAVSSTSGCEAVSITHDQAAIDYTCHATSGGGTNSATATTKRDGTKPVTGVTNVTEGATYALGSVPQAGCSSTDNLSGVAAEANLALTGGDVQGLGNITAICSGALDAAGNAADHAVVHYTVNNPSNTYNFTGFLQPVDNPGSGPSYVFNSVKAGGAVPVMFGLGGDHGLGVFSPGYPVSKPVSCTTAAFSDPIEQTVTAGNSGLSYDAARDTYTYIWKTNKGWAGTCRVLTLGLDDGTQYLAYFQFK